MSEDSVEATSGLFQMFLLQVCQKTTVLFQNFALTIYSNQRIKRPSVDRLGGTVWVQTGLACLASFLLKLPSLFFLPQPRTAWDIKATLQRSTVYRPAYVHAHTCHVVVHPVEHDLRGSVPPRGYISRHFIICVPRQTEVQDLGSEAETWWFSQQVFVNQTTGTSFLKSVPPLAHSLHSQPGYWASGPGDKDTEEEMRQTEAFCN